MKPATGYRWTICALVFFATTVTYLDRSIISLLKPAVFIIGFVMAAHQACSANIYTMVSDLFPKTAVPAVTGMGILKQVMRSYLLFSEWFI